jgi:PAS domain S-box-containing protein
MDRQALRNALLGKPQRPYGWLPVLIILMTVITLAIGTIALHYLETQLIASKGEMLALTAADIADKLDLLLFERYADIRVLAKAPIFQLNDNAPKTRMLEQYKSIYPVYLWLGVTDAQGKIIVATNPSSVGKDRSGREWFRKVRDYGTAHVRDAQASEDSGGVWAVAFTAPIRDSKDNFIGAISARVGLPALQDIFARTIHDIHDNKSLIEYQFLTRDGDVISGSNSDTQKPLNLKLLGIPSALLTASAEPGYIEEDHGRRHVRVVTGYAQTEGSGEFTGLHWGILVRMDRSDILMPIRAVLGKLGVAGFIIVLPLLGFLLWTTGRLRAEWSQTQEEYARATTAETALQLRDRAITASSNGIFIADPSQPGTPIIFANAAFELLTGCAAKDILGYTYRFLQGPDTDPKVFVEIREALKEKRDCRVMLKSYTNDGSTRWNDLMIAPIRSDAGDVTHFVGVLTDITDRKLAEEALRENQERFQQLAENIREVFWLSDTEKNQMLYISHGYEEIWRRPCGSLYASPRSWLDAIHFDDRERVLQAALTKQTSGTYDEEYRIVRPDGGIRWIRDRAFPVRDQSGRIYRIAGIAEDITERKRAESVLDRLRLENEMILNSAGEGIYGIDRQGYTTFVNPAAAKMLGWEVQELIGRPMHDVLHHAYPNGSHYPAASCPILASASSGEVYRRTDEVFWRKDGSSFPVEYVSNPIREGQVIRGTVVIFKDITDRKKAEERLKLYRQIVALSNDGIAIIDPQGYFLEQNEAHRRLLGYSDEELRGHTPALQFGEESFSQVADELARTGQARGEFVCRTKAGEQIHIDLSAFSMLDEAGKVICHIGIKRDISERKRAEEIRSRLLEQVISAQEEERGRIARELHDETGQSLTALLIGLRTVESAPTLQDAKAWAESLRTIASMTLQEVGRLAWGLRPSVLDDLGLLATLERYTAEYAQSYELNLAFETKGLETGRLPLVIETTLYRIVQEALTNIAKHACARNVTLFIDRRASAVQMIIKDDGLGFDVTQKLHAPSISKRLGLHGMQERAALLGGSLTIGSEPNEGTTISVQIPLTENLHGENSNPHCR